MSEVIRSKAYNARDEGEPVCIWWREAEKQDTGKYLIRKFTYDEKTGETSVSLTEQFKDTHVSKSDAKAKLESFERLCEMQPHEYPSTNIPNHAFDALTA